MISFLSVFPPYRGGIAKFSDSLYRQLTVQTEIKAFGFKKLYPGLLFPGTSQKLDNPETVYADEIFHPYQPFNWKRAAGTIMKKDPQFLLYSYWHPFFAPALTRVLKVAKKINPDLVTAGIAHNILPHEYFPLKKYLTKKLLDVTDLTVLLSDQTEADFMELNPESSHRKLFHPIYELEAPAQSAEELRKKYGFSIDDRIVLFLGLVRDYKGVDLLIESLNHIHQKDQRVKAIIAGEFYTDKSALVNQIDDEYRELYTIRDAFLAEKEMAEILTLADLLVLPYKKASQSGILANAIHFNLPALVANHRGLTEHITHRKNGLVFESGNAQDLEANLVAYFEEGLKEKLAANLELLKRNLSWEKFAGNLLESLESLQQN